MPPTFQRGGPSRAKGTVVPIGSGRVGGKGKGLIAPRRRHKVSKDALKGITRPAIRRLARRGGVKRISATIYDEVRVTLDNRLRAILKDCVQVLEYRGRKTVTVSDVIFSLRRLGQPIYGFDPETYVPPSRKGPNHGVPNSQGA